MESEKLSAQDIVLQPFDMEMLIKEGGQRITTNDFDDGEKKGVRQFLSTPKFIKALADLSDDLIGLPDQKAYLKNALAEINKALPAAVYIPFVSGKCFLIFRINEKLCCFAHRS